jgi:hypothetical protein
MKTGGSGIMGGIAGKAAGPMKGLHLPSSPGPLHGAGRARGAPSSFGQALAQAGRGKGLEGQGLTPRASGGRPAGTAHGKVDEEKPPRKSVASTAATGDPLDPVVRQAAQMAPPMAGAGPSPAAGAADEPAERARTSLEDLLPALVRKVAWSGDGRKGTVRLELGAGAMAGAEVVVQSEAGRVTVQLRAPAGVDAEAWRKRVEGRLTARGLQVDGVEAQ